MHHPVHHVTEPDAGLGVGESERATGTRPAVRPIRRAEHPCGSGLAEAERIRRLDVISLVARSLRGWYCGSFQRAAGALAQSQLSIAGGGTSVEFRNRPRVTRAVARGYLDGSPFITVEVACVLETHSDDEGPRRQAARVEQRGGEQWWHRVEVQHHLPLGEHVQPRHTVAIDRIRQPDVEIQIERRRDLVGEVSAERAPLRIHTTDEFGLIPTERDGVVAMPGAGHPGGHLRRDFRRQASLGRRYRHASVAA